MGPELSLMDVRRRYAELVGELAKNQAEYEKRKGEIIAHYGDTAHFRNDVILDDLSSAAKTLSAIASAYANVMQAECAFVQMTARVSTTVRR